MHYKAILFDLDGTLLPMDLETFTKGYFKTLMTYTAKYQIEPERFLKAMWSGIGAMQSNSGQVTNEVAFWNTFRTYAPEANNEFQECCNEFYRTEFFHARRFILENPYAKKAVALAREHADYVILATNPIFPVDGTRTRLSWLDLTFDDFDLVTTYESCFYSKPNPDYFSKEVLSKFDLKPEDCLLVGNDEKEDMYCASLAGIQHTFLVTDTMLPCAEHPYVGPKGSFQDLLEFLQ